MSDTIINLFDLPINNLTLGEALAEIDRLVKSGQPSLIFTPNVQHLCLLKKDEAFRSAYRKAALILPDGVPLFWFSHLVNRPLKARVAGADLFTSLCEQAARKNQSIFLLGSLPGVAEQAAAKLIARNPHLKVVGTYSPPFGFENDPSETQKILSFLREKKPDILFMGLTTPKSEKWLSSHLEKLNVPVAVCVGGAFDFTAGLKKRAPRWIQRVGLEWFFRLVNEPSRLWRRYFFDFFAFIHLMIKEFIKLKSN